MIIGDIKNWRNIEELKRLDDVFLFLENPNLKDFPLGKHLIKDELIYASITKSMSRPINASRFESHKKYIDIQYLIKGQEMIGFSKINRLKVIEPYNKDKDAMYYEIPEDYTKLRIYPGRFAVFFPDDGHMPNCYLNKENELHKVVIKLSISFYNSILNQ